MSFSGVVPRILFKIKGKLRVLAQRWSRIDQLMLCSGSQPLQPRSSPAGKVCETAAHHHYDDDDDETAASFLVKHGLRDFGLEHRLQD